MDRLCAIRAAGGLSALGLAVLLAVAPFGSLFADGTAQEAALIPSFTDRARIPAAGKQGPPGKAAGMIGNRDQGAVLFARLCQSCHGAEGAGGVPNPGSADGTVPPLKPIDPDLADKKPPSFAAKIDRYIQHGSIPEGSGPALFMPDWKRRLSQEEIASLENYLLFLNGVTRRK